jgi:sugar-specific transcriptional regulator TrmB
MTTARYIRDGPAAGRRTISHLKEPSSYGVDFEEHIQLLCDLGLTPIQARVYLLLLGSGSMNANNITQTLEINRVDAYRALKNLRSKGFIEISVAKPSMYSAASSTKVVNTLLKAAEGDFESLKQKAKHLSRSLRVQGPSPPPLDMALGGDQYFRLKYGESVIDSILSSEKEATQEVRKVVTARSLSFHMLYGVLDAERALIKRGVRVRILTDVITDSISDYSNVIRMRCVGDLSKGLRYVMVDDRLVLISLANNAVGPTDSAGLVTNNATLISALTSHFEQTWATAKS